MLPRAPAARRFGLAFAVLALVHLAAQVVGDRAGAVADLTQVLLMPLLAGVLWCGTSVPRGRLVTLTLAALALSWLGDTLPKPFGGDAAFLVMIGFFLLAQVAYVVAFAPYRARSVLHVHRVRLVGYVVVVLALVLACAGGAGALLVPVLVYGACLGTMAVLATGVNRLTAVGGGLFLVSDGLIALDVFVPAFGLPAQGFWVMATYVAAQSLLVAGALLEQARPGGAPTQPDAVSAR